MYNSPSQMADIHCSRSYFLSSFRLTRQELILSSAAQRFSPEQGTLTSYFFFTTVVKHPAGILPLLAVRPQLRAL